MSLNIRPLADRVVIEPAAAEEKTASGIIIPDTAKEKPQRGTVVAVGPGKKRRADHGESWRYGLVWQIFRYGHSDWRQRLPHHEGVRHPCNRLMIIRF